MKISVIISAYEATKFIKPCLDSIFRQNHLHEVLLAIDGCEETLFEIERIRKKYDDRLKVFYYNENLGSPYPHFNQLIQKSTGTHILPFGADDVLKDGAFDTLAHVAQKYDVVRFKCLNFADTKDVRDSRVGKMYFPGGAILFSQRLFKILGGYPKPNSSADSALLHRIKFFPKEITVRHISQVLCLRRIHAQNLTVLYPPRLRKKEYKKQKFHEIKEIYTGLDEALDYVEL